MVALHPTEWQAKSSDPKWQRLNTLLRSNPELLKHEQDRIDNLVFWSELIPADLPPVVYHVHPIAFIAQLTDKTPDDHFMYLARTIYGEARGQSYESKIAVGWIIRNRLATGRWGDTYKSVVTAHLQFTCWSQNIDPHGYAAIHNPVGQVWEDCKRAAREVMAASDDTNPLPGAINYYSPTAQTQLHAVDPDNYPETPKFAIESKRVPNPTGVRNEDYRFYKN